MGSIDADDFLLHLYNYAITTSDYDFVKKVRFAIEQYIKSKKVKKGES